MDGVAGNCWRVRRNLIWKYLIYLMNGFFILTSLTCLGVLWIVFKKSIPLTVDLGDSHKEDNLKKAVKDRIGAIAGKSIFFFMIILFV